MEKPAPTSACIDPLVSPAGVSIINVQMRSTGKKNLSVCAWSCLAYGGNSHLNKPAERTTTTNNGLQNVYSFQFASKAEFMLSSLNLYSPCAQFEVATLPLHSLCYVPGRPQRSNQWVMCPDYNQLPMGHLQRALGEMEKEQHCPPWGNYKLRFHGFFSFSVKSQA